MNEIQRYIEGIGEVLFKTSNKTRFIRLNVNSKNEVILTLPLGFSQTSAIQFLISKKAWINKSRLRLQRVKSLNTVFTGENAFSTHSHRLYLAKHAKNTIKSVVAGNRIQVWYPVHADVKDPRIQRAIRRVLIETWRIEARQFLPERVRQLANEFGFKYNTVSVKNATSRWGSCSHTNNINLNLQLMRLPPKLIDYVILHELNHTIHKHHQKSYWDSMEKLMPGAKILDKELNKYHLKYW